MISVTLPAPTFIKIDVEGAELAVLQGAEKLIEESRPTIVIEVGSSTSKDVIELLLSKGYQLKDLRTGYRCDPNSSILSDIVAQPE